MKQFCHFEAEFSYKSNGKLLNELAYCEENVQKRHETRNVQKRQELPITFRNIQERLRTSENVPRNDERS